MDHPAVIIQASDATAPDALRELVRECCWFASQVMVVVRKELCPLLALPGHVRVCHSKEQAESFVWKTARRVWFVGHDIQLDGRDVRYRMLTEGPSYSPTREAKADTRDQLRIGVVVVSCTDEIPFLRASLRQLVKFSNDIVLAFGGCMWNGEPEDEMAVDDLTDSLPPCVRIVRYNPLDDEERERRGVREEMFPEALARWTALRALPEACTHVLFLDSDEVIDGEAFAEFVDEAREQLGAHDAVKFANHWYWRQPTYRARDYLEDSCLLMRRAAVREQDVFSDGARTQMYDACPGRKCRRVLHRGTTAMVHHYSWVRSREQMLRKVRNWGHRRDIAGLEAKVHEEFSRPFNGTDFLRGLAYEVVPDRFGIGELV